MVCGWRRGAWSLASSGLPELDEELMNAKRFAIATLLYSLGPLTVSEIAKIAGLSIGDADTHLRRLREKGYVRVYKAFTDWGPRTVVELTDEGARRYRELLAKLRSLADRLEK